MADCIIERGDVFEYTYSAEQQEEVEKIRSKYLPKEESTLDKLRKLDKSAEKPGMVISIMVGIIGTLVFGLGMCCTMLLGAHRDIFVIGIIIGILGLVTMGIAYPLYQKITKKQREKIADLPGMRRTDRIVPFDRGS